MIQMRQRWRTNAPRPPAVSMATAVRRSNTDGIAQCSMSRATPEATGRWYRATTCSVLPQRPPGQQANKQQSTNTPKKLAVLMAAAVCRYGTVHIARWRRSRASLVATGCYHWASSCSDKHQLDIPTPVFFEFFHRQLLQKGRRLTLRPLFLIGYYISNEREGLN